MFPLFACVCVLRRYGSFLVVESLDQRVDISSVLLDINKLFFKWLYGGGL